MWRVYHDSWSLLSRFPYVFVDTVQLVVILRWPKEARWLVWTRDVDCQERLLGKQSCCCFPFWLLQKRSQLAWLKMCGKLWLPTLRQPGVLEQEGRQKPSSTEFPMISWLATMVKLHNPWCPTKCCSARKHKPWLVNLGELVYYTADDISNAKFVFLEKDDAYHPFLGGLGPRWQCMEHRSPTF